jgi:hypothetical protein
MAADPASLLVSKNLPLFHKELALLLTSTLSKKNFYLGAAFFCRIYSRLGV